MPFGLCNAPSVFQRFMNDIFRDLVTRGFALLYMDDIIIPAPNEKENIAHLRLMLKVASKHGLEINTKKCEYLQTRIDFLGHTIEAGTIQPSSEKISAVLNFPEPKTIKGVQSFFRLIRVFS